MTEIIPSRRGFLTGLGAALITAPAIVRAGSLMPVKVMVEPYGIGPMMSVVEIINRALWQCSQDRIVWRENWDKTARYVRVVIR